MADLNLHHPIILPSPVACQQLFKIKFFCLFMLYWVHAVNALQDHPFSEK